MALREITESAPVWDEWKSKIQEKTKWQSMRCRLVTPMYGGGVKTRASDKEVPVRTTAIRGQLRFWWRLLAKRKWKLPEKALRKAEFALWGGMDGNGQAGLVLLRVSEHNGFQEIQYDNKNYAHSSLQYVLFTARPTQSPLLPAVKLCREGLSWTLQWRFDEARIPKEQKEEQTKEQKRQVHETLRWWATFGGIGGRTRRGCGVFASNDLEPVTVAEAQNIGCTLIWQDNQSYHDDGVLSAWENVATQWQTIRRENKTAFRRLLGRKDEDSRRLSLLVCRPVRVNEHTWQGTIMALPDAHHQLHELKKD